MIIISESFALSPGAIPLDTPIFGWKSLVTSDNVSATTEADGFPVSNLGTAVTYQFWKGVMASPATDDYVTVVLADPDDPEAEAMEVDYVAVAAHNFGSAQITISVEGASEMVGSPEDFDWEELVEESIPANDDPIILRFDPTSLIAVRLKMQPSQATDPEAPQIGVMYVGKLLVAERGTHADHVPINLARKSEVEHGMSETGQFVGRITLRESRSTTFNLKLLRANWVRTSMRPFLDQAMEHPFFFAWQPQTFPNDVGFCWLTNDPQPTVQFETGRMQVDLQLGGIAV